MILASLALATSVSTWWLLLTAFVALNLLLFAAVGWCPGQPAHAPPRTTAPRRTPLDPNTKPHPEGKLLCHCPSPPF
nr:DUF2892 domain-containing protein [Williamsia sp. 1135]